MNLGRSILAAAMAAFAAASWPASSSAQDGGQLLLPPATYDRPQNQPPQSPVPGTPVTVDPSDEAFREALDSVAPLTPEQIEEARRLLDRVDRAQVVPLQAVNPVTRSMSVSLKSGERPGTVRVYPGWISTLTFSDVTGKPWPVLSVTNGNPEAYDVKSSGPENATNIITISARQSHVPSNIAITLVGAQVPILLTLSPSTGDVDFRIDAQVDQRGPNASYDVISSVSLPATGDSVMLSFLDGVPPDAARKLQTSARDVEAWRFDGMLYVRTVRSLLSPAFVAKQSNVSGVNVYVLKEAPILIVSDEGRLENVLVKR